MLTQIYNNIKHRLRLNKVLFNWVKFLTKKRFKFLHINPCIHINQQQN